MPPEKETDFFNLLCDGVLTSYSTFDHHLTEMLTLKDELLKYSLPSNLLINLTLTSSKLYRSASELSTPINELVRLVRLYSPQWESKSDLLKKIHNDFESKQRQLDIALKKLQLVGFASEKMAKEKRIRNWEKVFSKVMSAKSHGHRWKFLIASLKEKAKTGEILTIPYPSNSMKDIESSKSSSAFHNYTSSRKNFKQSTFAKNEAPNIQVDRVNNNELRKSWDERTMLMEENHIGQDEDKTKHSLISRFKSKYSFEKQPDSFQFSQKPGKDMVESPTGIRNISNSRLSGRRHFKHKNVSFFDESSEINKTCIQEDKSVGTEEKEYKRFLHVLTYKPECNLVNAVSEPTCTICFGKQIFKSKPYTDNGGMLTSEIDNTPPPNNQFQEFSFQLPNDNEYTHGQGFTNINSLRLRIAVQGNDGEQIDAMSTIEYDELNILPNLPDPVDTPTNYPLLSLKSDKDTKFNAVVGHVPIICYQTKQERLRFVERSSQTLTFNELVEEILAEKKKEEEEVNKEEVKIYSEADFQQIMNGHFIELEKLKKEYELQLQEIHLFSTSGSPEGFSNASSAGPKVVSASTSPVLENRASFVRSTPTTRESSRRPRTADLTTTQTKKSKIGQSLPQRGKDLPENFLDRLEYFSKASAKYHDELTQKTKKAVQESYELQLATQNRLSAEHDEMDFNDVCLPALFMPSRNGIVYSPKATLYFHPSGATKNRFTQAPSVFKLPSSVERNSASVLNLFHMSENFIHNRPSLLASAKRSRSAVVPGKKSEATS